MDNRQRFRTNWVLQSWIIYTVYGTFSGDDQLMTRSKKMYRFLTDVSHFPFSLIHHKKSTNTMPDDPQTRSPAPKSDNSNIKSMERRPETRLAFRCDCHQHEMATTHHPRVAENGSVRVLLFQSQRVRYNAALRSESRCEHAQYLGWGIEGHA